MKIIFVFAMCLFLSGLLDAQSITWQRLYNNQNYNDNGVDVCDADSGNYFVVCYSTQSGPFGVDIYILKLKPDGDTIWTRMLGDHSGNQSYTCVASGDGGCVITGSSIIVSIFKLNRDGVIEWEKHYEDESVILFDIIKTSDKGYIACGRIVTSIRDGYIIKIDSSGNLEWKRVFHSIFNKLFYSILQLHDQYIVAGYVTDSSTAVERGLVLKLNFKGEIVWQKTYLVNYFFTIFNKICKLNTDYLVGGSSSDSTGSRSQTFFIKLDTSGNIYYKKNIQYYNNEYLKDMKITSNNRIIFASDVDTTTGRNARVYITDLTGSIIYQKIFNINDYTLLRSILAIPNGDKLLVGTSNTYTPTNRDVYVVRSDSTLFLKPIKVKENQTLPADIKNELFQNCPNPFNPTSHLEFGISDLGFVSLKVYDILGKEVAVLVNEKLSPGIYKAAFNGSSFPSGVYFYRLVVNPSNPMESNGFTDIKRMVLIK